MAKPTPGAVCFLKSQTQSWVLGKVDSCDDKNLFTCSSTANSSPGVTAETCAKLKEEDVFVITNTELLESAPDDLLQLVLLHDSTLMYALNLRYFKDTIYTRIGPIVVAFNPFNYNIPWYKDDVMPQYLSEGEEIKKNKPHSWAVAHNTYYEMINGKQDQCVLVSGESGAGKTEAVKIVMKYLSALSCLKGNEEQKSAGAAVGHKLMQASPILEGFGNAKTVRNDNSSRFGKFMKVQFDPQGFLVGAHTTKYLLEKSRVVTAGPQERCYHAFYLLTLGKDSAKYNAGGASSFQSINSGGCLEIEKVDDAQDYNECLEAMTVCGIEDGEKDEIWKVVGALLNLLNVSFKADGEKSKLDDSKSCLPKCTGLLGIDNATMEKELLCSTHVVRGDPMTKQHTPAQALDTRDSLTKALYDELFSWLVVKINAKAAAENFGNFIGLLDIFGFEDFEVNSFEQLCINLANETLQHHYNTYIFTKDMEECRAEGVDVTDVKFPDNTPCLKLVTDKMGVLALLDEECALGKGTDENFLVNLEKQQGKHEFFEKKRLAKTSFVVKHYAGDVSYEVKGFLEKNRDNLKDGMKLLLRSSSSPFIASLLPEPVQKSGKKVTVGQFFKNQLQQLMDVINATNPHWIRCIKPHPAKKPLMWHGVNVFNQLSSSGIIGTVKVRKAGFPIRIDFPGFLKRFRLLKPGPVSDPKSKCLEIIESLGFDRKICQVGSSRVFMKSEPYNVLEEEIQKAAARYVLVVQSWVRSILGQVKEKDLDFEINKAAIIESVRSSIILVKEEMQGRAAVVVEMANAMVEAFLPVVEEGEGIDRQAIANQWEKELFEMVDHWESQKDGLDAARKAAIADLQNKHNREREYQMASEASERCDIATEESQSFKAIVSQAEKEQYERDRTREDEWRQRCQIIDDEQFDWDDFLEQEQEGYNFWKGREQQRLAEEWRNLMEGVYAVQEERKAQSLANEKFRYDSRRREMTERRRLAYLAEQVPRNNSMAERQAFETRTKSLRQSQAAKRETDADEIVCQLRNRKDLLGGPEYEKRKGYDDPNSPRTPRSARGSQGGSTPRSARGSALRGPDGVKHEALSDRTFPSSRVPLHTHTNPAPQYLISQPMTSTAEEIIAVRSPRSYSGSQGGLTPRGGEGGSMGGLTPRGSNPNTPRSYRSIDAPGSYMSTQSEPLYSPTRTRAAAGLDLHGNPVSPLMPQPNPVSPPKLGSYTPRGGYAGSFSPRQNWRENIREEFGI